MIVKNEIYTALNESVKEVTGENEIITFDENNLVDIGKSVQDLSPTGPLFNTLANKIAKVVMNIKTYTGRGPKIEVDGFEWGSIIETIDIEPLEAEKDPTYDIKNGESYDHYKINFKEPIAKYYNQKENWMITVTKFRDQVKNVFRSAEEFERFWANYFIQIRNGYEIQMQQLKKLALNNMIAETLASEISDGKYGNHSTARAVNLMKLYNDLHPEDKVTIAKRNEPEYIRFKNMIMNNKKVELEEATRIFNQGGRLKFTQGDDLRVILLNDYVSAAKSYLYGDTYHKEDVLGPVADVVTNWQGIGKEAPFEYENASKIDVITAQTNHSVSTSGIIGVMFDKKAVVLYNKDEDVIATPMNAIARYQNFVHHYETNFINNFNENFVVFYEAEEENETEEEGE